MEKIDNLDLHILGVITENARVPFKDVAAVCGVSRAAIHQRVQRLIEAGIIVGSGYNVNPKAIGYSTCTYVGIRLERGSMYRDVATKLDKIPEIVECHFTTGNYTMLVKLYSRRNLYGDSHQPRTNHQPRDTYPYNKHCGEETSQASHSPQENRSCGYGRHRLNKELCTSKVS